MNICGMSISCVNMEEVIRAVHENIGECKAEIICLSNVHTIVTAKKDPLLASITNSCFIAAPDGMPLVWYGRMLRMHGMDRVAGADLMDSIFDESCKYGYTHFFYGGTEETLHRMVENVKQKYPLLKIVGSYSPPMGNVDELLKDEAIDRINASNPHFLWVGLGAPKQEVWMYKARDRVKCSFLIGVGAAFNFYAGSVKRAPLWMQRGGLEWFFRLVQEPGKLWKRYLITNTLFLSYIAADCARTLAGKGKDAMDA